MEQRRAAVLATSWALKHAVAGAADETALDAIDIISGCRETL
jgi:hypothetical protein